MNEIREWLNSDRSYTAGIALYLKHGNDPLLKRLFQEQFSDFKLQKLNQVMEQLASGVVITAPLPKKETLLPATRLDEKSLQIVESLKDQVTDLEDDQYGLRYNVESIEEDLSSLKDDVEKLKKAPKFIARGWPKEMDDNMRKLYDQWFPLFTEKKNLQARIYEVALAGQKDSTKKKEAGAMAHKILDLRDSIRSIYKQRDYYTANKKLPEEKKPIDFPVNEKKWPVTLQNWKRYVRDYKSKLLKQPDNEDFIKQLEKYLWGVAELKKLMGDE